MTTIDKRVGHQSPRAKNQANTPKPLASTSWDTLAAWYDSWMGAAGSDYHRELAIPTLLELLIPQAGEHILDIGSGQGVLAPYIASAGATYTGIDASPRLLEIARKRHGKQGRFLPGDACALSTTTRLSPGSFDAVVFLLSIQDMDPLEDVLASASWALKTGGRLTLLLVHPAFRVPRQSSWGWDGSQKLHYRRVDSYLTPRAVPIKSLTTQNGKHTRHSRSFHRPLSAYINTLSANNLLVEQMLEVPSHKINAPPVQLDMKSAERARREIPLFLGIRAIKL